VLSQRVTVGLLNAEYRSIDVIQQRPADGIRFDRALIRRRAKRD
jgi:hypothetical protein